MTAPALKKILIVVLVIVTIAGIVVWRTDFKSETVDTVEETFDLQVIQFYLHLPEKDIIIGRDNPSFEKLMGLVARTLISIEASKPISGLEGLVDQQYIYDLQKSGISLSIWLFNQQKVKVANKDNEVSSEGNLKNIETDRILIMMGGKHIGTVLTRQSVEEAGEKWSAWTVSGESFKDLIEAVRSGGL